ncbi:hypothetical protein T484DRAFT_1746856 [Baffinella frigidus]|nr:hypothetical protein T484DRAFT_1746856 [Cryptophyta sp. CCMP2293]
MVKTFKGRLTDKQRAGGGDKEMDEEELKEWIDEHDAFDGQDEAEVFAEKRMHLDDIELEMFDPATEVDYCVGRVGTELSRSGPLPVGATNRSIPSVLIADRASQCRCLPVLLSATKRGPGFPTPYTKDPSCGSDFEAERWCCHAAKLSAGRRGRSGRSGRG